MIKTQSKQGYEIRGVECQEQDDRYILTWKYQKGTHFLIFLSAAEKKLNPEDEWKEMSEQNFQAFMESGEYRTDRFLMLLVEEPGISSAGKKYDLLKSDADSYLPGKIRIFSCTEDVDRLSVYRSLEELSSLYLPVWVKIHTSYRKICFTRRKKCYFQVDPFREYKEGMVCYRVREDGGIFPLTQQCLGKKLLVVMPRNLMLKVFISEEYAKCYRIHEVAL